MTGMESIWGGLSWDVFKQKVDGTTGSAPN